jgi:hypothetical protein
MGAASPVDMEESHAGGQGSRAARTTGPRGCCLHGSCPVQITFWGKEQGKVGRFDELRAGAGCVAPPPSAGDDDGGLTGLGFGGARRRRRPRVAQAERREGP